MPEERVTPYGVGDDPTEEHLQWLVDSRCKNQKVTLELYLAIKNNAVSINKDIRLAELAQELAAVAFSLWRAVFLSNLSEEVERQMIHVESFLSTLISHNAIAFPQDLLSREWTFPYYLKNARNRLLEIARQAPVEILNVEDVEIAARSAKEDWTITHDALSKAVARFTDITRAG
jgi:hypothetical protein